MNKKEVILKFAEVYTIERTVEYVENIIYLGILENSDFYWIQFKSSYHPPGYIFKYNINVMSNTKSIFYFIEDTQNIVDLYFYKKIEFDRDWDKKAYNEALENKTLLRSPVFINVEKDIKRYLTLL